MKYVSTRGLRQDFDTADAIIKGIAPDGGLFVPENFPRFSTDDLKDMAEMGYKDLAVRILSSLLDDFTPSEITDFVGKAYHEDKFGEDPVPLVQLNKYNDTEYILETWHGPTSAFKDIALQLLPHLMKASAEKKSNNNEICILTATSGDTGKAALEGFKDVDGTRVLVFYPSDGVSKSQKLQMTTQEGNNCHVFGVKGNFDDTQTGVKDIFADQEFNEKLKDSKLILSSANSINWGRLAPQIVYYFASYAGLIKMEKIEPGEKINFVVPTGNFGNILSAWYAMKMGLPINKLICASNKNKILSDFLRSGNYDAKRQFHKTNSPSMDILVSSNLERLLFDITDGDSELIAGYMKKLKEENNYSVSTQILKRIQEVFVGGFADDAGTIKTIKDVYDKYDHCVDTHTAVGFNVYERYVSRSKDTTKTVFVSTASPFKFLDSVSAAIFGPGYHKGRSEEILLNELSEEIGIKIPASLAYLDEKGVLHPDIIEKNQLKSTVEGVLLKES